MLNYSKSEINTILKYLMSNLNKIWNKKIKKFRAGWKDFDYSWKIYLFTCIIYVYALFILSVVSLISF